MRLEVLAAACVLAACASTPTDDTAAIDRACTFTDCFAARDVRDFEVIDRSTLIVFVGRQRCAFQVDLRGAFCDMTFATDVFFTRAGNVRRDAPIRTGPGEPFEIASLGSENLVVCANDLQINVDGGAFGDVVGSARPVDRFGNPRSQCQIGTIVSLTDDQLIDLYVARGVVPPPPPMGTAEIEVGEQEEQGATPELPVEDSSAASEGD